MNLVLDIGNSLTKTAVFDNKNLIHTESFEKINRKEVDNYCKLFPIKACIISSVASIDNEVYERLKEIPFVIELSSTTLLPIKNNYSTPETLGNDRLANVVGAFALYPQVNVLVVDAGTCLKFDFINRKGVYSGGAIAPGLLMRYKALHQFTKRLPLLEPKENSDLIGDSTSNSIHSGILNGMIAEINGVIEEYKKIGDELQVILCGGDLRYFSNHLKNNIFALPHLTLRGLNEILLYNQ